MYQVEMHAGREQGRAETSEASDTVMNTRQARAGHEHLMCSLELDGPTWAIRWGEVRTGTRRGG